jgi:hypothetical protein
MPDRGILFGKVGRYSVLQYTMKLTPYSSSICNCFFRCRACVTMGYSNITLLNCRMEELQKCVLGCGPDWIFIEL